MTSISTFQKSVYFWLKDIKKSQAVFTNTLSLLLAFQSQYVTVTNQATEKSSSIVFLIEMPVMVQVGQQVSHILELPEKLNLKGFQSEAVDFKSVAILCLQRLKLQN